MDKPLDQETNLNEALSEENKSALPQEETVTVSPEKEDESPVPAESSPVVDVVDVARMSKAEMVERLAALTELDITKETKMQIDALKHAFYKERRAEVEEAKKAFLENGGVEEDFVVAEDEAETKIKELLTAYRERKTALTAETERVQEENLQKKKAIIARIKELAEIANEDFYAAHTEFRELQQEWKEIKKVPAAAVNELWKEYQLYSERFYDLWKINNEMRDYDFKKNLELKQTLIESIERLDEEKDVVSAYHQLQKLQQEFREAGPVAKELRDETWDKFKQASLVINKKHQNYFEQVRSMEKRNREEKAAICQELEAIDFASFTSFEAWDIQSRRVKELQEKWRTIGYAPKKVNAKIFERFRDACNAYFKKKKEYYKNHRDLLEENLLKKTELCEKAEAIQDSEDWKETTDKFVALQKEWKAIGALPRRSGEDLWKRFMTACNHFFKRKNSRFASQKSEEAENLKLKNEIIKKIKEIDEAIPAQEAVRIVRGLMTEWNTIGFVPFRVKDKVYDEYRAAVDKLFERLKLTESERRLQSFRTSMTGLSTEGKSRGRLLGERERLMRTYERLKTDIQTYENNIGFLSVSSKGGGGLVKEMNRKVENLKEELELIIKKIQVIDENFESGKTKQ